MVGELKSRGRPYAPGEWLRSSAPAPSNRWHDTQAMASPFESRTSWNNLRPRSTFAGSVATGAIGVIGSTSADPGSVLTMVTANASAASHAIFRRMNVLNAYRAASPDPE